MSTVSISVILIEDNPGDAQLLKMAFDRVFGDTCRFASYPTVAEGQAAIATDPPNVILIDLNLVDSDAEQTLEVIRDLAVRFPVIVITGMESRTLVNQVLGASAQDYLVKGQIQDMLLQRTVRYAIQRFRLVADLRDALARIRQLSDLLPVCPCCRQIRDERASQRPLAEQWVDLESYILTREDVQITHGICPACLEREISLLKLSRQTLK